MARMTVSMILLALFMAACDAADPAVVTPEEAFMAAEITGAVVDSHQGPANFLTWYHARHEMDVFSVNSSDTSAVEERSVYFMGYDTELVGGSAVPLMAINTENPAGPGFTVVYIRDGDRYLASEGSLTPGTVSDSIVTATFSFRAFKYCEYRGNPDDCPDQIPTEPPADAVWIDVEGEFVARPRGEGQLF